MCAIYEPCEVCGIEHRWDGELCRWPITARTLFYLDMPESHPHAWAALNTMQFWIDLLRRSRHNA